jgi:hypothetical protein
MVIDDFSGCMSRTAIISHLKHKKFLPLDEILSMRLHQKTNTLGAFAFDFEPRLLLGN